MVGPTLQSESLRAALKRVPEELKFGTSGRRGKVANLTQLEIYINVLAELEYLQTLAPAGGGIVRGEEFYFAYDLRPSSSSFVAEQGGCGEIAQAAVAAIRDAGMHPVNLGRIPTPALASYALARGKGSIMVTGSHIPFDRNGYKTCTSRGELSKEQEAPINAQALKVRARTYGQAWIQSAFNEVGNFKRGHQELPPERADARTEWIARFTNFFLADVLRGKRLLVYQHSAVGRDLLVGILEKLGAEVITAGRSDTFVPIDTENIDAAHLAVIQALADEAIPKHGPLFGVVSTDGDSDRPLVLGFDDDQHIGAGRVRFFGGDLVGMVVAEYLRADAVVVPISCNDAIDHGALRSVLEPKTRVGSPFVIAGMEAALRKGKRRVCGWESNGGFLTGSGIELNGSILKALPTRDALLPILATLCSAAEAGLSLSDRFARLPKRFSRAALLKEFPREISLKMLASFAPGNANPSESEARGIRQRLATFFTSNLGFGAITGVDYTDGVRISFDNDDVAHLRPSGNADELRIYAAADTQERADAIAAMGAAEPDGILRRMEKTVTK
jgi:phosphomannomutase